MPINVEDTLVGLDALSVRVAGAAKDGTEAILDRVTRLGRLYAPIGVPGNSTDDPGTLRESIIATPVEGGRGVYAGRTGPTTVYGRQRELGGDIDPVFARRLHFFIYTQEFFLDHVYQYPRPYMAPAWLAVMPLARGIMKDHIGDAIAGS